MVQVESEGEFETWVVKKVYIKSLRLPDWNGFRHKTAERVCNTFYSTVPHVYKLYINNNPVYEEVKICENKTEVK